MINRKSPKVSIVIPSYNQGKFIGQTIDSLLEQGYPNLEIIVIDGGSTDSTIEVLKSYGQKIFWVSEPDNGQTDAINKGLRKSTGEILAYLNSDDYLLPGALETVVQSFRKYPQSLWLTGDYCVINVFGQQRDVFIVWYKSTQRLLMQRFPILQGLLMGINNPVIQPSTFWRRELQQQVGLFDTSLRYTMDYDYWWRALKTAGGPIFLPNKLSAFRVHGEAKGGHSYIPQVNEQYQVAQRQGVGRILLALQKAHSAFYTWIYSFRHM